MRANAPPFLLFRSTSTNRKINHGCSAVARARELHRSFGMETVESTRQVRPDALRVLSLFAVIVIHSSAPLLIRYNESGAPTWWIGNLYDSLFRWCIPMFIMLSGSFLIKKADGRNWGRYVRRRVRRTVFPFLVWSAAYFLWRKQINGENLEWSVFFVLMLRRPIYYHLWFLYIIVGLYFVAPVLNQYLRGSTTRNRIYLIALWVSIVSILPLMRHFSKVSLFAVPESGNSIPVYVGYFLLGHLLRDIRVTRQRRLIAGAAFISAFFVTAFGTYYVSIVRNGGLFDGIFYEYYSLNVATMAVAIYVIPGRSRGYLPEKATIGRFSPVFSIAACVPGMYFIHAMVIAALHQGMAGFTLRPTSIHPALGVPVFAVTVFFLSYIVVFALRKIPIVRYAVP